MQGLPRYKMNKITDTITKKLNKKNRTDLEMRNKIINKLVQSLQEYEYSKM